MEKSKRILVVDDEETLCEALKFNLEEEGFEVDTALSAEEALTLMCLCGSSIRNRNRTA